MRFGTIGTGPIADTFYTAAAACPGFEPDAVYSRSRERALQFAVKYGCNRAYDDLAAFMASPRIQAVYVASPTSLHFAHAKAALQSGKHVLCEKPAATNSRELAELLAVAKEHNVLFLEASRHLFAPSFSILREQMQTLGPIRRVSFVYNQYSSRYDKFKAGVVENAFDPSFSNGALMDIGVYCVQLLIALFGPPAQVSSGAVKLENGLDGQGSILASYAGMLAELSYSKISDAVAPSVIQGENGALTFGLMIAPPSVTVVRRGGGVAELECRQKENNLNFEIDAFLHMARSPHGAEAARWHAVSQQSMALMDEVRAQQGIVFPGDSE